MSKTVVGETAQRKVVRTEEHSDIDKQSSTTKHPRAKDEDFEILASNYPDRRRRILKTFSGITSRITIQQVMGRMHVGYSSTTMRTNGKSER